MAKPISSSGRKWAGDASRADRKAALNLGIISNDAERSRKYRRACLEDLDGYYENRAYDHLTDWEEANKAAAEYGEYTPIRGRKPRIIVNLAKVFSNRVAGRLVGIKTFPAFNIEDDPDTQEFLRLVQKATNFRAELVEPARRLLVSGSVFVRFFAVVDEASGQAAIQIEHYLSKYCYPEFDVLGQLDRLVIKYVYDDADDLDDQGQPRKKWFKLELGRDADISFDNPLYVPNSEPEFQETDRADHNLGFVQGTWFRTAKNKHYPDGPSLIEDSIPLIDEINYNLSQGSQAVSYNQEPQLGIKGLDADQMEDLVKSSTKAWNLGREGEAGFIESDLGGVQTAGEFRDKVRTAFQDVSRVSMHDPEKMNGDFLSGKAMELLHGPFVELVEELRAIIEPDLVQLLTKITTTMLVLMQQGADFGLEVPKGWAPQSLNISVEWPPVFPTTMKDLTEKVNVANTAASGNLISRETATRWIAADFGVEDVEEEIARINAQPVLNPFGSF